MPYLLGLFQKNVLSHMCNASLYVHLYTVLVHHYVGTNKFCTSVHIMHNMNSLDQAFHNLHPNYAISFLLG